VVAGETEDVAEEEVWEEGDVAVAEEEDTGAEEAEEADVAVDEVEDGDEDEGEEFDEGDEEVMGEDEPEVLVEVDCPTMYTAGSLNGLLPLELVAASLYEALVVLWNEESVNCKLAPL